MTATMVNSDRTVILAKILMGVFAMSGWIDISGLFVELSVMVHKLPEGWTLPSYYQLIGQVANVSTVAFFIYTRVSNRRIEIPVNYIIIIVGIASLALMIFFWDHTIEVRGAMHSIPLLILVATLSLVDCTSSISFLAYLSNFPASFVGPFYVGDGLSALLPSVASLIQGNGGKTQCVNVSMTRVTNTTTITYSYNISGDVAMDYQLVPIYPSPTFSVEAFMGFLIFIMVGSLVAYTLLNNVPKLKKLELTHGKNEDAQYAVLLEDIADDSGSELSDDISPDRAKTKITNGDKLHKNSQNSGVVYWGVLQFWSCLLQYGVLGSISSYSALPYGNLVFLFTLTLPQIANPLTCLFAHYFPISNKFITSAMLFVATTGTAYLLWLAATSPYPFLCGSNWGGFIEVAVSIIVVILLSYCRVTSAFRTHQHGRRAFIVNSFVIQCGALVGAVTMFPLINYTDMFNEGNPCTQNCYRE